MERKIRIDKYREYKYSRRSNDKKVVRLYAHANLIDVRITSNAYRTQPTLTNAGATNLNARTEQMNHINVCAVSHCATILTARCIYI